MRSRFDEQLLLLKKAMINMGALCESAIAMSAKAVLTGDKTLARQVPELASQIHQQERDIEGMCLKLLLQQQPVARDLRVISSALKMVTDMERIGHQSADIAEIMLVANLAPWEDGQDIHDMAEAAIKMVTDSIDAFVRQDVALARSVIAYDDVVDSDFCNIKQHLIGLLQSSTTDGEYALDILMIAKYFERIADHAVNIAKWVLFSITGDRKGETE